MCVWRVSPFTAETMRATGLVANLLRNDLPGSADFASAAWRALRELARSPEPRGKSTDLPVRRQPNFVRRESPRGHTVPRRFQCCWNSPTPARNLAANRGAGCGKFRRERDRAWKIPQRADLGRQVVGHMANLPRFRGIVLQGSPTAGMRRGEMPPSCSLNDLSLTFWRWSAYAPSLARTLLWSPMVGESPRWVL